MNDPNTYEKTEIYQKFYLLEVLHICESQFFQECYVVKNNYLYFIDDETKVQAGYVYIDMSNK